MSSSGSESTMGKSAAAEAVNDMQGMSQGTGVTLTTQEIHRHLKTFMSRSLPPGDGWRILRIVRDEQTFT